MSDIQRWYHANDGFWMNDGPVRKDDLVLYADHVEALRQATDRVRDEWDALLRAKVEQGQWDALAAAMQRVEALWESRDVFGYLVNYDVRKDVADAMLPWVIAAIKGDSDGSTR